jgi:hypothetical protein
LSPRTTPAAALLRGELARYVATFRWWVLERRTGVMCNSEVGMVPELGCRGTQSVVCERAATRSERWYRGAASCAVLRCENSLRRGDGPAREDGRGLHLMSGAGPAVAAVPPSRASVDESRGRGVAVMVAGEQGITGPGQVQVAALTPDNTGQGRRGSPLVQGLVRRQGLVSAAAPPLESRGVLAGGGASGVEASQDLLCRRSFAAIRLSPCVSGPSSPSSGTNAAASASHPSNGCG